MLQEVHWSENTTDSWTWWSSSKAWVSMEYGQPLFVWLSRDRPSVRTYVSTRLQIVRVG